MLRLVKKVDPIISTAERVEIVRSIMYVDSVHIENVPDKLETWRQLHFTHFFKGERLARHREGRPAGTGVRRRWVSRSSTS